MILVIATGCGQSTPTPAPPGDFEAADSKSDSVAPATFISPEDEAGSPGLNGTAPPVDSAMEVADQPPSFVVQPYYERGLRETVRDSLGRIGQAAVPPLTRMLRHPDAQRRIEAARILARIGPDAHDAVDSLVEALQDSDLEVRKAAAYALGQIGSKASDAVGPLLEILEEEG
jgi:HEAT repeat protein